MAPGHLRPRARSGLLRHRSDLRHRPLLYPDDDPKTSSEALYSNCTVALDAETGKLVWYYQHMPNDQWDLDWVFERQIAEVEVGGAQRKVVLNIGKMAILDALDAETGEYLFSIDAGIQNIITAIDPETGEKNYDPEKIPDPERDIVICPSLFGARSWPPASYSPDTRLVYAPLTESCIGMGKEGFQLLTSGVGLSAASHPGTEDGTSGLVAAYDLEKQKIAWVQDQRTPPSTSMLATASGLLFSGDLDPALKVFDHENGELLFETELDDKPSSSIVSYEVDGKQYIALVVGFTNNHVRDISRSYEMVRQKQGDTTPPPKGNGAAIVVFSIDR